jgi:predicted DNA binding CopG/RHH family protein
MTASNKEAKMKATTIRLPEDLLKQARIHALELGTTFQALVIEGLTMRLETKRPGKEGKK